METKEKRRFTRSDVFTIPNLLSFFRLLLIPVIVTLYLRCRNYRAAALVVALSGLTDIADGKIARNFKLVSDVGKILDPVADKLTQAAMILCLLSRYSQIWFLLILFAVKEILQAVFGYITLRATNQVNGARWYGKVSTVTIYAVMILLFLLPELPLAVVNGLIALCGGVLLLALLLYARYDCKMLNAKCSNRL